jgi:hypothetical protein
LEKSDRCDTPNSQTQQLETGNELGTEQYPRPFLTMLLTFGTGFGRHAISHTLADLRRKTQIYSKKSRVIPNYERKRDYTPTSRPEMRNRILK